MMDVALPAAVGLVLLGGAFALGLYVPRPWVPVLPLALPGLFGVLTLITYATGERSNCYEECAYHWGILFTALALIVALALGLAAGIGVFVGRRRSR